MKISSMIYWMCVAVLVSTFSGCQSDVADNYGMSESSLAQTSPGGLSVLREMVKARKKATETLVSLRPSLEKDFDTIVWAPDYFPQHSKQVTDRLENWLSNGGKTLVYIGRDYSPHADYWDRIASGASNQKMMIRRERSKIQVAKENNRLDSLRDENRDLLITPWFYYRKIPGDFRRIKAFGGKWSEDPELSKCYAVIRSPLSPFDSVKLNLLTAELDWNTVPPATGTATAQVNVPPGSIPPPPRKPRAMGLPFPVVQSSQPYSRIWNTDDEELLSIAKGIVVNRRVEPISLLEASDGTPLVTEVSYKSSSSRVIVLSNSSMVSNLGMLNKSNRHLAQKLIDTVGPGAVGFLSMDSDPPIREGLPQEEHKGFEMLTVWPFNVMTIHAAIIAMVAFIASYPIFGRARSLPEKTKADFSEHVGSLGDLLQKAEGREFAKDSITRYFRVVRRDFKSPWANRESVASQETQQDERGD